MKEKLEGGYDANEIKTSRGKTTKLSVKEYIKHYCRTHKLAGKNLGKEFWDGFWNEFSLTSQLFVGAFTCEEEMEPEEGVLNPALVEARMWIFTWL